MSYTLKEQKDGYAILFFDGRMKTCPHKPPMAVPGTLKGDINFINHPCTTACALFEFRQSGNGIPNHLTFSLACAGLVCNRPVELEPYQSPTKPIIK